MLGQAESHPDATVAARAANERALQILFNGDAVLPGQGSA